MQPANLIHSNGVLEVCPSARHLENRGGITSESQFINPKAIVRVPLDSQDQVDKLVDLCLDLHLEPQRSDICRAWARQLEQDNQTASALQYFEKGQSFADIERLCWNILERMLLTGISIFRVLP
jgi:Nup85 Nucleoporin